VSERRTEFYPLYLTRFANSFGYAALIVFLPFYTNQFEASGLVVGLFTTSLTVAATIAVIPLSWAGDRYDKRTVLLCSIGLSAVTYLVFTLVDGSTDLILARFLQGLAFTGIGMIALAVVGELAGGEERATYIGISNAWRMAAGIGGSVGVGVVYSRYGFDAVYAFLVVLLIAAGVGVYRFIDPDETSVSGFALSDLALNDRILTLTAFRAPYAVAITLVRTWVPLYAGVVSARGGLALGAFAVSLVVAAEKTTNMIGQPFAGRVSDTFGRALFVFAGGAAYGVVALGIPLAPDLAGLFAFTQEIPYLSAFPPVLFSLILLNALLGVVDSFREPASMALFADEGEGKGIVSAFGIRSLVWRPGQIAAPLAGGWLMDSVGMTSVFYVGGGAAVVGALAFLGALTYSHGVGALTEW
jgi:MFS family permease